MSSSSFPVNTESEGQGQQSADAEEVLNEHSALLEPKSTTARRGVSFNDRVDSYLSVDEHPSSTNSSPEPTFIQLMVGNWMPFKRPRPSSRSSSTSSKMKSDNQHNRTDQKYRANSIHRQSTESENGDEGDDQSSVSSRSGPSFFQRVSRNWVPSRFEDEQHDVPSDPFHPRQVAMAQTPRHRSWKRRLFLLLTEPDTSIASAIFFIVLITAILLNNMVMMLQTMERWQFTPTDCRTCGGDVSYLFDDDNTIIIADQREARGVSCTCPPTPVAWTIRFLSATIYFFTVEWSLRVLCFEPPAMSNDNDEDDPGNFWWQWFGFVTSTSTVLDALAIFPYYIEMSFQTNGLMSLRLLRLFRVFQLVRLGQYNDTFMSLTAVLFQSVLYLKLLLWVLLFGAAFFGSMLYWLEKGDWKYFHETESYEFVRVDSKGVEEISPFTSIPATFWWFFVTATTVGYGDCVPSTAFGKFIATLAMLTGVLVIAFPVSVFSDLWSKELRKTRAFAGLFLDDDEEEENDVDEKAADEAFSEAKAASHRDDDDELLIAEVTPTIEAPLPQSSPLPPRIPQSRRWDRMPTTSRSNPWLSAHNNPRMSSRRIIYESPDHVILHHDEMAELAEQLEIIQDSQRRIRAILRSARPYHPPNNPSNRS